MYSTSEDNLKEYKDLEHNNIIENDDYSTNQSLESHITLNNSINKLTEKSGSKDSFVSDFSKNDVNTKKKSKNEDQEYNLIVSSVDIIDHQKKSSEKSINITNPSNLNKVKKNLFLSMENIADGEKHNAKNLSNKNKDSFNIHKMFEYPGNHFNKLYQDLSNVKQSTPKNSTKMDGLFSPKLLDEKVDSNVLFNQSSIVSPLNLNNKNNSINFTSFNKCSNYDKLIKVKKIGEGTFGNVYLVKNKCNNFYALKKYFNNKETDMRFRLQKIVKLIKMLNHISLPDFYETFFMNNHNFVLTEYYEYSLDEVIKKIHSDSISSDTKSELLNCISLQVISAIIYLHQNKVVHRDLKPSNIMINKEGIIKLIDLDFTKKLYNEEIKISLPIGTTFYKSPELILGLNEYSYPQDIWSLGCIIAEIYLGYPLFESRNEIETLFLIKDFSKKVLFQDQFNTLFNTMKNDIFNSDIISNNISFNKNLNDINSEAGEFIKDCLSLDSKIRFDISKKEKFCFLKNHENIDYQIVTDYLKK